MPLAKKKKKIEYNNLVDKISELCLTTNYTVDANFCKLLKKYISKNNNDLSKRTLQLFFENKNIAEQKKIPVCQDTGICIFFVEYGIDVEIIGGLLNDAINAGVAKAYTDGYLRKSIAQNAITRKPLSKDNTPAIIYTELTRGNNLKIWFLPKGGGSENVSAIKCFNPTADKSDISNFIITHIKTIGANACPPYKLAVCIGGSFDYCAVMSKRALIDDYAKTQKTDKKFAAELLKKINNLNIGPQGFGGLPTAVKLNLVILPTHIAMLPVAISISCNAARIGKLVL